MIEETSNRSEQITGRQSRTDLLKIRDYMEQHYAEPLSVEQLAQLANISPKYFVDLFKRTFGQSAIDYLTDLRINRAKRYLMETNYRLREIAQLVGYSDEFYFSRKFKKEVGVSPSAFVKNPRLRIAACTPSIIGQLLALNIIPVVSPLDSKWTPYYYNVYQTKIKVHMGYGDDTRKVEWDKLVKARPDAIVGTELLPVVIQERLTQTAPALFIPIKEVSWREQFHQIALFLGREEQERTWIQGYEQKIQLAQKQMEQAIGTDTFVVIRVYGNGLHIYCNQGIHEVLYQDLKLSPAYLDETLYNREFTLEQLGQLNPDRILVLVCPETASRAYWLSLQHHSTWLKLKAMRLGHIYPIPSDPWFEYSAVAINRMLDEMLLLFTGYSPNSLMDKVHGNP
ncbi:MAG: AraC family transcriptional regulator [Candidatus Pristimantibacillus sp.]